MSVSWILSAPPKTTLKRCLSPMSSNVPPKDLNRAAEQTAIQSAPHSIPALPRIDPAVHAPSGLRLSQRIAGDLVAVADLLSVIAAAQLVVWVDALNRLATPGDARNLLLVAPVVAVGAVLAFRAAALYEMRVLAWSSKQASRLLIIWLLLAIAAALALTLIYQAPASLIVAWLSLAPAILLSTRALIALCFRLLLKRGPLARRVALIGALPGLERAADLVNQDRLMKLAAIFSLPPNMSAEASNQKITNIMEDIATGVFDDVIVLVPSIQEHGLETLIDHLEMLPTRIALLPVIALQNIDRVDPGDVDSVTVTLADKPVRGWSIAFKLVFDYVTALLMLAVFGLPMIAIAIAIKLESKGPVFFRQQRTGLGGHLFRIWKFRSMTVLEDGPSIKQAERDDLRVTKVGRFIRRMSLDELPQIFNVLAGEMSVVGPRPHARAHDDYYARQISDYRFRFRVKPGITGLAQINGYRGQTKTVEDMAERISYDIDYAANYSFWCDLYVVLLTPIFGLISSNSY